MSLNHVRRHQQNERAALWQRVEGASFLTRDEKRAAVGYGAGDDAGEGAAS